MRRITFIHFKPSEPVRNLFIVPVISFLLLALEGLYLSQTFDAFGLIMQGDLHGWRWAFGHLGDALKIIVVTLVLAGLLLKDRLASLWAELVAATSWRQFAIYALPHLVSAAVLLLLSARIFSQPAEAVNLPHYLFALWLLSAFSTVVFAALMAAPLRFYRHFFTQNYRLLGLALGVGLAVWLLAMYTRELWGPMSELTFVLSALLLHVLQGDLMVVYPDDKILGLGDFLVNIAPACSGYEGVGLVCAFVAVYLFINREKMRFPQALLLFPIGALVIWLLNVVRIAVLIIIGHHWSPDVAVGGFHSQAGWIAFIGTSLVLLWLAGNNRFFARMEIKPVQEAQVSELNLPIATLVPMVTLLAAALITAAFSAGFDWFYPLRVIAVAAALVFVWPHLQLLPYRPKVEALLAGVAVAIIWALMLGRSPEADTAFQASLDGTAAGWALLWLVFRFIGSAVTVPIAEELAFRGYMLCRLSKIDVITRGPLPVSVFAIALSSLAFGVLHGAWLAGTVAGAIYALVRLRSHHIGDAILAHAITNALLFVYAFNTGVWSVL